MEFSSDSFYNDNKPEELAANPTSQLFDSGYIEGIRLGKKEVIDTLYNQHFSKVRNLVLKNSGNLEDARDVFQETLIAIYRNSQKPDFTLSCRFDTYMYAIARNLWFVNLRKRNMQLADLENLSIPEEIEDLDETINSAERYQLYTKTFSGLGEQCKKLLLMFMQGISMKTIAAELGFASESYAKKRKFKCKEQLIAKITEDKDYKRIMARE